MLTFLFWNLYNADLTESLVRLAVRYQVDVFIFVECKIPPPNLLIALNPVGSKAEFHYDPGFVPGRIEIFTRFSGQFSVIARESSRYSIRRLILPGREEIILATAHLPSPLHSSEYKRREGARLFAEEIRSVEAECGHDRTIVVGDLNLNPFDDGVASASALHGVMSKAVAQRLTRFVERREYPFFYNPMWSKMGDSPDHPPGTYYYDKGDYVSFFWNVFDQVLIRPSLIDYWDDRQLHVLTDDGVLNFLSERGIPNKKSVSDHLPILFRLNI